MTDAERQMRIQIEVERARAQAKADVAARRQREGTTAPEPLTLGGFGKSVATGLRSGVEAIPGAVGDIPEVAGRGAGWASRKTGIGDPAAAEQAVEGAMSSPLSNIAKVLQMMGVISPETGSQAQSIVRPTSRDIGAATDYGVNLLPEAMSGPVQDVTRHQPTNRFEELTQTTASFAPSALFPGSAAARVVRPFVLGGGVEGAGQLTRELAPEYEEAARLVAGLVLGHAAARGQPQFEFQKRAALDRLGTNPEAMRRMQTILQEQGMTPADVAVKMRELGVQAMPLDVGPNLRQEGQQIMAAGGPGRAVIDPLLREREAGKNARLTRDVTGAVGPEVQRTDVLAALKDRAADLSPEYKAAHAGQTKPVETQPIIDAIDSELAVTKTPAKQGVLERIKSSLRLKGTDELDPSSEGLHEARKAIDAELYDAKGNVREDLAPEVAGTLKHYRKQIDEQLGAASPAVKEVDVKRAQIGKEERAFKTGERLYRTDEKALSPVEFKRTYDAMSEGERTRLLEGVNRETWRRLGVTGNNLVELQKTLRGEGKWNHEKLVTVLGEEKTNALMSALEREKTFNETHQKVVQGSKTAESLPPGKERPGFVSSVIEGGRDAATAFPFGGPGAAVGAAYPHARNYLAGLLGKGRRAGGRGSDAGLARLLSTIDPDLISRGMAAAEAKGSVIPPMALAALEARKRERREER